MARHYPVFFFTFLLFCSEASSARRKKHVSRKIESVKTVQSIKDGPATIFIHGTIIPVLSRFTHGVEYPYGIISLTDCHRANRLTKIAHTLHGAAPERFPLESFYFYCWPGNLKFSERKKATEKLYSALCQHAGPLTIIAHSHGCNVALYLAELAGTDESATLLIDRLILLASPVQLATAHLVRSPVFKQVFSFYSSADLGQIIDPQGMYEETKKVSKDISPPLFSRRTFDPAPNLVQARILFNKQSPGHVSFITPRFLHRLPSIITLLEACAEKNEYDVIVNIPRAPEEPHLLHKMQLAHAYVPRAVRCCRCTRNNRHAPLLA